MDKNGLGCELSEIAPLELGQKEASSRPGVSHRTLVPYIKSTSRVDGIWPIDQWPVPHCGQLQGLVLRGGPRFWWFRVFFRSCTNSIEQGSLRALQCFDVCWQRQAHPPCRVKSKRMALARPYVHMNCLLWPWAAWQTMRLCPMIQSHLRGQAKLCGSQEN